MLYQAENLPNSFVNVVCENLLIWKKTFDLKFLKQYKSTGALEQTLI